MAASEQRGEQLRDYRKLFQESYLRTVVSGKEDFFDRFYAIFMSADPRIPEVFSHTDMHRQVFMLQ